MNKPSWFRERKYLHFDNPVGYNKANKIISNHYIVAKHSFYPFIQYNIQTSKISKGNQAKELIKENKKRPISYAAHLDSQIYAFYAVKLSELYETELSTLQLHENILAFRKIGDGKCNIHFAHDAFEKIKAHGECNVIAMDFSKFFDTLDHKLLKEYWSKLIGQSKLPDDHFNIYKSLTQFSYVDRDKLYAKLGISKHNPKNGRYRICSPQQFRNDIRKTHKLIKTNQNKCGIPQGSPISALLSNIYLLEFDKNIKDYANLIGGTYYRYCDDILFVAPTTENIVDIKKRITTQSKKVKVSINEEKTVIRKFRFDSSTLKANQPLQYLGFLFNGENVYIRSASLSRYSERMKCKIRLAKKTKEKHNRIRQENNQTPLAIFKRNIYSRYTHLGRRNFLRYGYRSARIMNSKTIKRQLKPLWNRVQEEIVKE